MDIILRAYAFSFMCNFFNGVRTVCSCTLTKFMCSLFMCCFAREVLNQNDTVRQAQLQKVPPSVESVSACVCGKVVLEIWREAYHLGHVRTPWTDYSLCVFFVVRYVTARRLSTA
jgi:hypothetical protein